MPYFYAFCGGFHPDQGAVPRFSTHLILELMPQFGIIPTHLELFQHPPQLEHPLFCTWKIHRKLKQLLWS